MSSDRLGKGWPELVGCLAAPLRASNAFVLAGDAEVCWVSNNLARCQMDSVAKEAP